MDRKTCVLICFSVFLDATPSSQIDCFLDDQECQSEADNLIDFLTEIPTAFTNFGRQLVTLLIVTYPSR